MLKLFETIYTPSSRSVSQAIRLHFDWKPVRHSRIIKMDEAKNKNQDSRDKDRNSQSASQHCESGSSKQFRASCNLKDGIKSKRRWRYTEMGSRFRRGNGAGFDFAVMSYNILSQNALEEHKFLYQHCKPNCLGEKYRLANIIDELRNNKSDIICLQEVEHHVYENILNIISNDGYQGIYKKRTGDKTDGCCIFWLKRNFELLTYRAVEFKVEKIRQLDRDNIGLIVCLKPLDKRAVDVKLFVATTHLLFNPRRGDIKFCQLRLLLAELDRMAFIHEVNNIRQYQPIILCGDFNFTPESPLYKFLEFSYLSIDSSMMTGNLSGQFSGHGRPVKLQDIVLNDININNVSRFVPNDVDMVEELADNSSDHFDFFHSMHFVSSRRCESIHFPDGSTPVTSMVRSDAKNLDHMFYSVERILDWQNRPLWSEDKLALLGTLECLSARDIAKMGGLPNECLSSDHIFIMSKFIIPNK